MGQEETSAMTGHPVIDTAHDGLRFLLKRMFQQGVECRRGVNGDGGCDHSACTRIDAISRYLRRNFAAQERMMAETGYPDMVRHRGEHTAFLDRLAAMRASRVCADVDGARVMDLVAVWNEEHAARSDMPLGQWARFRTMAAAE